MSDEQDMRKMGGAGFTLQNSKKLESERISKVAFLATIGGQ